MAGLQKLLGESAKRENELHAKLEQTLLREKEQMQYKKVQKNYSFMLIIANGT